MTASDKDILVKLATPKDCLRIRQIVNHSSVAPTFLVDGTQDMFKRVSQIQASMRRVQWFLWDGGVFMCIPMGAWVDIHIAVLPEFRGVRAIEAADVVSYHMFTKTPCETVLGTTPSTNKPGIMFARQMGFTPLMDHGGKHVSCLTLLRWLSMLQDPEQALRECEEHGFSFKTKAVREMICWGTAGAVGLVRDESKEVS